MQTITPDQQAALQSFAKQNGRSWKAKLNALWMNAAAPQILHSLRNSHGPSWLASYRLPRADPQTPKATMPRHRHPKYRCFCALCGWHGLRSLRTQSNPCPHCRQCDVRRVI